MIYNISNGRTLDNVSCEFFENGDYTQVVICGIVSGDGEPYPVVVKVTDHLDYNTLKEISTCEFSPIANVVKADACEMVEQHIVTELDKITKEGSSVKGYLFANQNS